MDFKLMQSIPWEFFRADDDYNFPMYFFFLQGIDSDIDDNIMQKEEVKEHIKLTHLLIYKWNKSAEAIFHNFYKFNEIYSSILICIKDSDHLVAVLKFFCFFQSQNAQNSLQLFGIDKPIFVLIKNIKSMFHLFQTWLLLLKQFRKLLGTILLLKFLTFRAAKQSQFCHHRFDLIPLKIILTIYASLWLILSVAKLRLWYLLLFPHLWVTRVKLAQKEKPKTKEKTLDFVETCIAQGKFYQTKRGRSWVAIILRCPPFWNNKVNSS